MTKSTVLLLSIALLPALAFAKKIPDEIRYKKGSLKSIRCSYFGRTETGPSVGSVNFTDDAENTVCDPLSNTASPSQENGLLAKLIVRNDAMGSAVSSVLDYLYKGTVLDKKIYFASVNVPTRTFTQGFATQTGDLLLDSQGNKLIENFSLEYTSLLQLGPDDTEGDYEIASLSDDGVRLFVQENGTWNELVNNDGNHLTRMGCPYRTIHLTKDSRIPIKLLYYQGPRYYITNVLIWKKHPQAKTWKEPSKHSLCGYAGNDFFYNASNGKKNLGATFLELTGWRTIGTINYKMPPKTSNPCSLDPLNIINFAVTSIADTTATLTWTTNFPASSRLRILNQQTFEEVYTDLDATLVTSHAASLTGLTPGITYQVQAISMDAQGREVRSAFIDLAP